MGKVGVAIAREGKDYQSIKKYVLKAEELGYDSIWMTDHLGTFPTLSNDSYPEVLTLLSALSAVTSKIRLGILVLSNSYRHPSLLAKISSTMDFISDGRLEFGIGAGWFEAEYKSYGYPYPKASERIAQLKEGVQIIKLMWTQERPSFTGKYYTISEALCSPKPVQKPYPPITIGGEGDKIMHVVATEADRWNFRGFFTTLDDFKVKNAELNDICKEVGRNPSTLERSVVGLVMTDGDDAKAQEKIDNMVKARPGLTQEDLRSKGFYGTASQVEERLQNFKKAGASYFMLGRIDIDQLEMVRDRILKPAGL